MCGRFTRVAGDAAIHERFGVEAGPFTLRIIPRYHVPPTQTVAVVANKRGGARAVARPGGGWCRIVG